MHENKRMWNNKLTITFEYKSSVQKVDEKPDPIGDKIGLIRSRKAIQKES